MIGKIQFIFITIAQLMKTVIGKCVSSTKKKNMIEVCRQKKS